MLPLIILGLAGCSALPSGAPNGFPSPKPPTFTLTVNPSSITVAAGSRVAFTAVFSGGVPQGGSLTWSVNPANCGTINSSGVYTSPGNAGNCSVVATWTPSSPSAGSAISGSATVTVLPEPAAELNSDLVQASGAVQTFGAIQNSVVLGQLVPFQVSTDANGNVQIRSSFVIPVACTPSNTICP
jgi:hypothetical protein